MASSRSILLRLEGLGLDITWVRAIYVGVFTESFLDFSLFSMGDQQFGLATIVQAFEPQLKRRMDLAEDHLMKVYLKSRITHYSDLRDVRKRIIEDIPDTLPTKRRVLSSWISPKPRASLRPCGWL